MSSQSAARAVGSELSAGSSDSSLPVVIAGAGLAGCMSALLLAQQYHKHGIQQKIIVLEHREDFRLEDRQDAEGGRMANAVKRSINLALSHRGMCALLAAGLSASSGDIIPMKARLMHDTKGHITQQPYGSGEQAIYSISRRGLNELLLNELDKMGEQQVEVRYGARVTAVKQDGTITYRQSPRNAAAAAAAAANTDGKAAAAAAATAASARDPAATDVTLQCRYVLGADGAYSKVREEMRRYTRMDFAMSYIKHGYKELTIPPAVGADGQPTYAMSPWQGLHIWPRDEFMLIALPNPDYSFTCTLFFPLEGPDSLQAVDAGGAPAIRAYFQKHFPDVVPLMPDLVRDYESSPNSALLQIKCDPYHAPGARVAILGDAAHACVPFYGQGMNAAFEDCLLLSEIMNECGMDTSLALPEFSRRRVAAGQALADLSFENYTEMRHHTASGLFLLRKRIEAALHRISPQGWIPQYTMVAFTRIPYDTVVRRARKQERFLKRIAVALTGAVAVAAAAGTVALLRSYYPALLPRVFYAVRWPRWMGGKLTTNSVVVHATPPQQLQQPQAQTVVRK